MIKRGLLVIALLWLGMASADGATIKADTFVDTANVQLQNHVPTPSGTGAWDTDTDTRLEIGASNNLRIDSTTVHKSGRETTTIGSANMRVSLTCALNNAASAAHKCGPSGRIPDTENGLANSYQGWAISDGSGTDLELVKVVASTTTSLGTFDLNGVITTPVVVLIDLQTGAKKLYADTVERISSADDSLTGNTYAGVNGLRNAFTADDYLSESVVADAQRLITVSQAWHWLDAQITPPAHADDGQTVEWYVSDICQETRADLPGPYRYPCLRRTADLRSDVVHEVNGKMYLRVLDTPLRHAARSALVRLSDVQLPAALLAQVADRGLSRIDGR